MLTYHIPIDTTCDSRPGNIKTVLGGVINKRKACLIDVQMGFHIIAKWNLLEHRPLEKAAPKALHIHPNNTALHFLIGYQLAIAIDRTRPRADALSPIPCR